MAIWQKIEKLNPRTLFFADAFGALLTATFLTTILANFEPIFGMPPKVLYGLAAIAVVFFAYSFACYWWATDRWRLLMNIIAIANLSYCGITTAVVAIYFQRLSPLALGYFFIEVLMVVVLSSIELNTATNAKVEFNK